MKFDPIHPICDGILYSDLWMMRDRQYHNVLASRGIVYLTEFLSPEGIVYSGDVIARTAADAQLIVFARGLGEVVDQRLTRIFY